MRNSKAVNLLAGLVTVGAWGGLLLALGGGMPPRLEAKSHQAAGWMLARQAVSLLKPGGQITVITRDTTAFKNPAGEVQLASFKKTLRKAGASLGTVRTLQIDPLKPVEVPPGDFLDLIRHTPAQSVIVSFMGPPLLTETQLRQLGPNRPGVVALCSGSLPDQVDLRGFFQQGLLQGAVIARRHPLASQARGLQGWFDRWFVAVTAATDPNLAARGPAPGGSQTP